MKPIVFVSSTFYDLKYIREDLSKFIRSRDFDPVLFENGDVWYIPGKKLESSCYDAMKKSDMAILIIGGKFGTESTEFTEDEEKKVEDFISITCREFKTAVDNNITVFAFVDSKVANEYDIYIENEDKFVDNPKYINFKATSDIRVFKFIKYVYSLKTVSVTNYSRVSEIKEFLSKQWSYMFKQSLTDQKQNEEIDTIKKSISKLENVVAKIEIMMNAVGKNVLKGPNEYESIKDKQRAQEICEYLKESIMFDDISYNNDISIRSKNLIDALIEISNDFVKNQYKAIDFEFPNSLNTNDLIDNHIVKILINYDFDLININRSFIDLIRHLNEDLNNVSIRKEIKKLLEEKYYKELVRRFTILFKDKAKINNTTQKKE